MTKEKPTTKTCKQCKTEIPYGAKICPQCRKKQGPGGCMITIVTVIAIGVIVTAAGGGSGDSKSKSTTKAATTESGTSAAATEVTVSTTEAPIEYIAYTVDEMMDDLDSNALKTSKKYDQQYVEVTGRLSTIDASGKYISLHPMDDRFSIVGVMCYIQNDDQAAAVMEMSTDDIVILTGKITAVGEVMGYSLDIHEVK